MLSYGILKLSNTSLTSSIESEKKAFLSFSFKFILFIPITYPFSFSMGPPVFPTEIKAECCK